MNLNDLVPTGFTYSSETIDYRFDSNHEGKWGVIAKEKQKPWLSPHTLQATLTEGWIPLMDVGDYDRWFPTIEEVTRFVNDYPLT
jgi:hypothetical protein